MSQLYEIVLFTAGHYDYAQKLLTKIDPKKRISHLLSRDHCIEINGSHYLKNARSLGRDMNRIVVIDVRILLCRIIFLLEFCSLRISIKYSPLEGMRKIENLFSCSAFLSLYMKGIALLQSTSSGRSFNPGKLSSAPKQLIHKRMPFKIQKWT